MVIQLKSAAMRNFLSLSSAYISFEKRGFVLVEGRNNNPTDNATSNGSGKSAIFEAIFWTLTGDTIRGTKDIINKFANDGACCEVEFVVDNNTFKITRFREDSVYGNNLKITYNGTDISGKGIRDSESVLKQYLPELTAQLLGSVVVLGQGLPQRFTSESPSGRKDILEKLSKSDYMIEDIKARLSESRMRVNFDVRKVQDSLVARKATNDTLQEAVSRNQIKLESLPDCSSLLVIKNEVMQAIEQLQVKCKDLNDKKQVFDHAISNLRSDMLLTEQSIQTEYQTACTPLETSLQTASIKLGELNAEISTKSRHISDAVNIQTECPVCHRPFDGVHKPDTTALEAELSHLKAARDEATQESAIINEHLRMLQQEFAERKKQAIESMNQECASLQQEQREAEEQLRTFTRNVDALNTQLRDVETQISANQANRAMYEEAIQRDTLTIEKNIGIIKDEEDEEEKLLRRVDALNKLINIASKDFRTYLLDGVIQFINERVKHYSTRLFGSSDAEFRNDGNQIWIGFCGKQYENLSGGEKQKIDIVVQFALRDMLMQILNFSCNILVLDEVFDNLDESGCNNLIDLISEELRDVESLFIVTHHADISIPYDDKLTVVKNADGISVLE